MSLRRARIPFVAGVIFASPLAGLAVAESSGATVPDTDAATSVPVPPDSAAVEILPPDASWAGATRGEWAARETQWNIDQPEPPAEPKNCGFGHSGPLYFMTLPFGLNTADTCVVPEGTAILVTVTGGWCSTVGPEHYFGRTEDELRACATAQVDDLTGVEASINGHEVAELEDYLVTSSLFTFTVAENSDGMEPGVAQAVVASYNFIIAPPPPGEYVIDSSVDFSGIGMSRTLIITVQTPQVIEPPTT
jgi:hypothetical protein